MRRLILILCIGSLLYWSCVPIHVTSSSWNEDNGWVINCNCDDEYLPVCGTDGKTYSNACFAECYGIGWVLGPCEDNCIDESRIDDDCTCPEYYDPVCGCDGVTYSNECFAACAGIVESWTKGPCTPGCIVESKIKEDCICEDIAKPVCGCDGNTYITYCEAECKGVQYWTLGACADQCIDESKIKEDCVCIEIYAPVCGCDEVTYSNKCFAECDGVVFWTIGICE